MLRNTVHLDQFFAILKFSAPPFAIQICGAHERLSAEGVTPYEVTVQYLYISVQMRFCCLKNCESRESQGSLSFYIIKDGWSEFLNQHGDGKWRTRRRSFVCSKHFEQKLIKSDNRLLPDATPTIPPG